MNELISIIKKELAIDFPVEETTPLISSGLIDSFQVVQLLASLESHYGVRIHSSDIGADNFDTPQQIYQVIQASKVAHKIKTKKSA